MDNEVAIKVDKISKSFKLPHEKHGSVKNAFVGMFGGRKTYEKQQVLKDISLEIKKGEFFGIVGRNGSGKSTLLKLLAGIYSPNSGAVTINGKLTPFIELGVGFNPELTGRENVFLNGSLLGFSRKEMEKMYDEIVGFAELENFMDQKLKNYSSGMQVRLAFSISITANTDILLIDEVLAVGDALFQRKCFNYFKQLKKSKKTVIFVSHDNNALQEYCDRGILIEEGNIIKAGEINRVVSYYLEILNKIERENTPQKTKDISKQSKHLGNGRAKVETVKIRGKEKIKDLFTDGDDSVIIEVVFKAEVELEQPVYGITITDAGGKRIFVSNTLWSQIKTDNLKPDNRMIVKWVVPNIFNEGEFDISPAIADRDGSTIYDWVENAANFKIRKSKKSTGVVNTEHKILVGPVRK